jgi:hypothetical protein
METKMNQYDVFWVNLDPTQGSEMAKTRPCVIINLHINCLTISELSRYKGSICISKYGSKRDEGSGLDAFLFMRLEISEFLSNFAGN